MRKQLTTIASDNDGAEPLSEAMKEYCEFDPWEQV